MTVSGRPLHADKQWNRDTLIAAALEVCTEQGENTALETETAAVWAASGSGRFILGFARAKPIRIRVDHIPGGTPEMNPLGVSSKKPLF